MKNGCIPQNDKNRQNADDEEELRPLALSVRFPSKRRMKSNKGWQCRLYHDLYLVILSKLSRNKQTTQK